MPEKLIRIHGENGNYFVDTFNAPSHTKTIICPVPVCPETREVLTDDLLDSYEKNGTFSIWFSQLFSQTNAPIDKWFLVSKYKNRFIPSALKEDDGKLYGKLSSKHFHKYSYLLLIIYCVIVLALAFYLTNMLFPIG